MAVETLDYSNPLGQFHQMVDSMRDREQDNTRNTGLWAIIIAIIVIALFYFWNQSKIRNLDVAGTLGSLTQSTAETQAQTASLRRDLRQDEQFGFWERPSHAGHCGPHGHGGGCCSPAPFYGGGYGSGYGYGCGVPVNGGCFGPFNYSHGYPVPEFKFKKVQEYAATGNPTIKETEVV